MAAAGAPPPAAQPPAGGDSWYSKLGVNNPETVQWLQAKNYADPAIQIDAHRNLEKLLGSDKVAIPTKDDDVAGWDTLYNRLGRPEKADGYGLTQIEGADPAFAGAMSAAFHKAGLSKKQADALAKEYQATAQAQATLAREQFETRSQAELTEWQGKQGQAADQKMALMKRVLDRDGLSDEQRFALENALGTAAFLTWLDKRTAEVAEDSFPNAPRQSNLTMTAQAAEAKIKALTADPTFMSRYMSDDQLVRKPAMEEMERLFTIKNGGAVAA